MADQMTLLKESLKDIAVPRDRRWTNKQVEKLKAMLNEFGLLRISDALGSLQFDLFDAERRLRLRV